MGQHDEMQVGIMKFSTNAAVQGSEAWLPVTPNAAGEAREGGRVPTVVEPRIQITDPK